MKKVIASEVEELRSPQDFNSLTNLKELANQEQTYSEIGKNLQEYKQNFINTIFKTKVQVLEFIADKDKDKFYEKEPDVLPELKPGEYSYKMYYKSFDAYLESFFGSHGGRTVLRCYVDTKNFKLIPFHGCDFDKHPESYFSEDYRFFTIVTKNTIRERYNYNRAVEEHIDEYKFDVKKNQFIEHKYLGEHKLKNR